MKKYLYIFLFTILIFNTLRYLTYTLGGAFSVYNIIMLVLNIAALVYAGWAFKSTLKEGRSGSRS
ncbi:hypothetical protein [Salipaludibacillus aurantiacus]|uniref:Uncharacterized protein n=1 Tax=Salipaludibacillus aurantiacus TaxID=1601833 RepID=A0A1H9UNP5_9BACI|nr:hypothetical protein [Salipaludibacillus aurantiacus]SES10959.1 hypothetical protein SAMN05518684_10865 [Salipaludibacillus aurantiacus]